MLWFPLVSHQLSIRRPEEHHKRFKLTIAPYQFQKLEEKKCKFTDSNQSSDVIIPVVVLPSSRFYWPASLL